MLPRSESAESLSSLFSNRRSNVGGAQKDFLAGAGPSSAPQQAQGGTSHQEERIQLKSMVIQRELTETSCIAYAFCLEKPRKLRLGICVNESSESGVLGSAPTIGPSFSRLFAQPFPQLSAGHHCMYGDGNSKCLLCFPHRCPPSWTLNRAFLQSQNAKSMA